MAVVGVTPAVLQYIDHNAFPEDSEVQSADLGPEVISSLLHELQREQDLVKDEIRSLSKGTAPDIDTWISRAKELQTDLVRSRDTARQIVAEHEAGRKRKAEVEDTRKKVQLLEREVAFEETLAGTLEHIRYANGVLSSVQHEAVRGDLRAALNHLEQAEESIGGLDGLRDTKACGLLQGRARQLKESLQKATTERWQKLIRIDHEGRKVTIKKIIPTSDDSDPAATDLDIESLVVVAQGLDIYDGFIQTLSRDLERTLFRPCLLLDDKDQLGTVKVSGETLACDTRQRDITNDALFTGLAEIVNFLVERLPKSATNPLSRLLVPAFSNRLEDQWLEPAVPLGTEEMPAFQAVLGHVQRLAVMIDGHGWHGTRQLHDWVNNAPRTWLTKRREAVLGDVRNLVFAGLRQKKTVERIETQMLSKDDHQVLQGSVEQADDEWDTAWDEPEEEVKATASKATAAPAASADGDEASAWDADDLDAKPINGGDGTNEEGEAWGWGDDEQQSSSPEQVKKPAPSGPNTLDGRNQRSAPTKEREMTLRETFTVTAVPDGVLELIQHIIHDAQTLADPADHDSPIAPAATALYTIPTLALAIYRATAPTAYSRLPTGNMLVYNDASHLSSKLRDWQASEPPESRLRLDNDVKALETFAKRAYSSEMESQRTILRDLLDGAQGFSSVTNPPFKQESEDAVEQTVHRLREVQRQWKDVLSDGALLQSLGSLLSTITTKMITEICELGDIGAEDSHQLRALMDRVSEAKDIFLQQREGGEPADMTFIYCPNWLKFQYLAEILESSLADIKYLWNEGELSLEFEAEEVMELIEGLFADSDIRRRAINEIRRSGR
ncbi:ribosome biogenesis protein ytm1 [Recurvomyces mirabilis]|uniref:Ribosome biogenesis protein ytm1 n=1 Tax=Recurvomyces mirabilis TaxID=574656 RepID=A0AAE1C4D0_9PEZI|nr:ribosome biogenesis protein ytm1 [Recurvomyces mirabilis]KAK5157432.1 ribosome biogenesis protein ytm1 [Recurvomyces mirabilis]